MKKMIFAAILVFAVSACATRGTNFNMADVDSFQPGVTTYDDVVAKLGKPRSSLTNSSGDRSVTWVYAQVGLGASESKGTRIIFDKDGKMVRVASKVE